MNGNNIDLNLTDGDNIPQNYYLCLRTAAELMRENDLLRVSKGESENNDLLFAGDTLEKQPIVHDRLPEPLPCQVVTITDSEWKDFVVREGGKNSFAILSQPLDFSVLKQDDINQKVTVKMSYDLYSAAKYGAALPTKKKHVNFVVLDENQSGNRMVCQMLVPPIVSRIDFDGFG